jgi:hypothetical protein
MEFTKLQLQSLKTKNNTVFIPDKAQKQNLPPYQHKVCAPICNILHTVSAPLHSGLQRNDQCRTHDQCLSSVESSARETGSSVSESDGVSDGDGSRQTLLFHLFEGPGRAFDARRHALDVAACLIFSFRAASNIFC